KTGRRPGESGIHPIATIPWHAPSGVIYRCQVALLLEEDGRFSAYAMTLPGVASQGKTEEEALDNIVKAFEAVLAVYKQQGETIPWTAPPRELERGAQERWVIVHG